MILKAEIIKRKSADQLPDFPLRKHVYRVGTGQYLARYRATDYKIWHMEGQTVPHSVHQVCAIFMD